MPADRTLADFTQPPPEVWAPGGVIDEYRIDARIGSGGMGEVFAGTDTRLDRPVAIKTIKPELAAKPGFRQRFLQEARAVARIDNEHVVPVYASGEAGGRPFLVMPLLRGRTLYDALGDPVPMAAAEVLRIGRQIALGLAAAHARQVIHRDIKPTNIWLDADGGRAKILDFGLARPADGTANQTRGSDRGMGTAGYMAPEQARGLPVDFRADLFSLGCVLYHLVAWQEPFPGDTVFTILEKVTRTHPPAPIDVRPDLPAELEALTPTIARLLAKDPAVRDTTADRVADELARLAGRGLPTEPVPRLQPRGWRLMASVIAATATVVVALGLVVWPRVDGEKPPPEPPPTRAEVAVGSVQPVETPVEAPPPTKAMMPPPPTKPVAPPPTKPIPPPPPPPPPAAFAPLDASQIPPADRPANAGKELAAVVHPVPLATVPRPWELVAAGNGSAVALFGEGELRLLDGRTLAPKASLPLTLSRYTPRPLRPAVALAADGSRLAVCDRSGGKPLVRVFDLAVDPPRDSLPIRPAATAEHGLVAFAPTGRTLYVVWQPAQAIERYDCPDTGPERTARVAFADGPDDVWSMAVAPDGKLLAVVTRRGAVRVFDLTGKEPQSLGEFPFQPATARDVRVQFVADRELTITAGGVVGSYSLAIGRDKNGKVTVIAPLSTSPSVAEPVVAFPSPPVQSAFAAQAKRLYAAHEDGVLRGWDTSHGIPERLSSPGLVRRIALSANGRWLAVETVGPGLVVYRLTEATPTPFPLTLGGPSERLVFDGNNRLVAERPAARRVWWDLSSGEPVARTDGRPAPPDDGNAPRPAGLALPADVIAVRQTADGRGLAVATLEAVYLYRVER